MSYFFKKQKGFTIIEILVVIVLCIILLMAVLGVYLASDKVFKKTRPISDVLEEMRSAMATLDFVFSRWGTGVPCYNNNCTISDNIPPCPETIDELPSSPLCMKCNSGDFSSGCSDVEFYANLGGYGFVVSVNGTQANLISCRLSTDTDDNYYYIWNGYKVINYNGTKTPIYKLSELNPNNYDCIKNFTGIPNAQSSALVTSVNGTSIYILKPGDMIKRVPYRVNLYVAYDSDDKGYWLYIKKFDMAKNEEEGRKIAKVKDSDSFKVYLDGRAVRVEVEFQSQSKPENTLKIKRYFAR
uniref:Prepilin-type N-terminal cleavage/methylation domain-containing protein n=1 Tax=Thermodesulfobacterium geofontis TaxID=1295609 RepID=A0A7V5XHS9_9BACT